MALRTLVTAGDLKKLAHPQALVLQGDATVVERSNIQKPSCFSKHGKFGFICFRRDHRTDYGSNVKYLKEICQGCSDSLLSQDCSK